MQTLRRPRLVKPQLWTPAQRTDTLLWLDALQGIQTTGSFQWNDLSGNANHATEGNTAPGFNSINGKRVVHFTTISDSTNDHLLLTSQISTIRTAVFLASEINTGWRLGSPGTALGLTVIYGNSTQQPSAGTRRQCLLATGAAVTGYDIAIDGDGSAVVTGDAGANGGLQTDTGTITGQHIDLGLNMGESGGEALPAGPHIFSVTYDGVEYCNRIALGRAGATFTYKGRFALAELLFFSTVLTQAELDQVTGYLAHKWNLVAKLNAARSDHPYAHNPPLA